jgi:hypothetical protein
MHQYVAWQRKTSKLHGALPHPGLFSFASVVPMRDVIYSVYIYLFVLHSMDPYMAERPVDVEIVNGNKRSHIYYINTT